MYKAHAIEAENTLIRVSCMRHQDMTALTVASFAACYNMKININLIPS